MNVTEGLISLVEWLHRLECKGTRPHPGCGKPFYGSSKKLRFCQDCAQLDKQSSYVFAERRQLRRLLEEATHDG